MENPKTKDDLKIKDVEDRKVEIDGLITLRLRPRLWTSGSLLKKRDHTQRQRLRPRLWISDSLPKKRDHIQRLRLKPRLWTSGSHLKKKDHTQEDRNAKDDLKVKDVEDLKVKDEDSHKAKEDLKIKDAEDRKVKVDGLINPRLKPRLWTSGSLPKKRDHTQRLRQKPRLSTNGSHLKKRDHTEGDRKAKDVESHKARDDLKKKDVEDRKAKVAESHKVKDDLKIKDVEDLKVKDAESHKVKEDLKIKVDGLITPRLRPRPRLRLWRSNSLPKKRDHTKNPEGHLRRKKRDGDLSREVGLMSSKKQKQRQQKIPERMRNRRNPSTTKKQRLLRASIDSEMFVTQRHLRKKDGDHLLVKTVLSLVNSKNRSNEDTLDNSISHNNQLASLLDQLSGKTKDNSDLNSHSQLPKLSYGLVKLAKSCFHFTVCKTRGSKKN